MTTHDDIRIADFYVLLEPRGYRKAAAVGTRQSRPGTAWNQVAVRVRLTLPANAFTQWVPLVEATVEEAFLVPPTADIIEPASPEVEADSPADDAEPALDSSAVADAPVSL